MLVVVVNRRRVCAARSRERCFNPRDSALDDRLGLGDLDPVVPDLPLEDEGHRLVVHLAGADDQVNVESRQRLPVGRNECRVARLQIHWTAGGAVVDGRDSAADFLPAIAGVALEDELQQLLRRALSGANQHRNLAGLIPVVLELCLEQLAEVRFPFGRGRGRQHINVIELVVLHLALPAGDDFPGARVGVHPLDVDSCETFVILCLDVKAQALARPRLGARPLRLVDLARSLGPGDLELHRSSVALRRSFHLGDRQPLGLVEGAFDLEFERLFAEVLSLQHQLRFVAGLVLFVIPVPVDHPVPVDDEQKFLARMQRTRSH